MARRPVAGQRVFRRRRIRDHLGPAVADRTARRSRIACRAHGALGDGARDPHARDDPARHHGVLAAHPERLRAGDPRSRLEAARPAAPRGGRRRDDLVRRRPARGVVPARDLRRNGAEERLVLGAGACGAHPRPAAGRGRDDPATHHRRAERDVERRHPALRYQAEERGDECLHGRRGREHRGAVDKGGHADRFDRDPQRRLRVLHEAGRGHRGRTRPPGDPA